MKSYDVSTTPVLEVNSQCNEGARYITFVLIWIVITLNKNPYRDTFSIIPFWSALCPLWPIFEQLFFDEFLLGNGSRCHHYRWMLLLVELDVGSIYPNPVLGFGKFWSIPNKIGTHFRMALDNWMSLINLLSNAYVSAGGRPVTADATCPHSIISQKRTKSSEDGRN